MHKLLIEHFFLKKDPKSWARGTGGKENICREPVDKL